MARFAYIQKILSEDEEVITYGEFHWLRIVVEILWWLLGPVTYAITWLIAIYLLIDRKTTELAVTNKRVIYKRGWIARSTEEIRLDRIEEISFSQGVFGRIFGYGKWRLTGTGGSKLQTHDLKEPLEFRRAIDNAR